MFEADPPFIQEASSVLKNLILIGFFVGISRSGFFNSDPDPSPLIFSICRYQILIWYLALTNIFLDNTAVLRKKYLHPSCSLIGFFILLKQSLYFHMALSYSAYAIPTLASTFLVLAGESVTLHCDSRPSCTASLSVWETQLTLGTSILSFDFFIFFTLSHKMTWTRCLSISQRSASPRLPVLHALLYDTHGTSAHTGTF